MQLGKMDAYATFHASDVGELSCLSYCAQSGFVGMCVEVYCGCTCDDRIRFSCCVSFHENSRISHSMRNASIGDETTEMRRVIHELSHASIHR